MAEENKFLEIVDLKKGYGSGETRQEVLRGMTFSVARGEICVLLGPSGSGKSTLLNIIGGIDSADAGFISIGGDKLEDMGEKALTQYRRKHLGYVFQLYNLIARRTSRSAPISRTRRWILTRTTLRPSSPSATSRRWPISSTTRWAPT